MSTYLSKLDNQSSLISEKHCKLSNLPKRQLTL